jgi:hypothetical protein
MKFSDLFTPASLPAAAIPADALLRIVRIIEIPSFNPIEKIHSDKKEGKEFIHTAAKAGSAISALPAPLVPLDQHFVDGQRYREAGATEFATRLDLFVADPAGPWIRRHGILLSA